MSIIAVRDAWVEAVRQVLPELRDCSSHGGRFDLAELGRTSIRTPAVKVAVLRVPPGESDGVGRRDVPVEFAAYIVAKDAPGLDRDDAALVMCEALCALVPEHQVQHTVEGQIVPIPGVGLAERVTGQSLFSKEADGKGFALWAVTWTQVIRIGTAVPVMAGPAVTPSHLYVGLAPDIGAAHEAAYVQLTEGSAP